jgi:predicted transcriptional regulator YdeE
MIEKNIPEHTSCVYLAKGKMPDAIGATWTNIWKDDAKLNRAYLADFDIYTARAQDPNNAEVDIFVGIKK